MVRVGSGLELGSGSGLDFSKELPRAHITALNLFLRVLLSEPLREVSALRLDCARPLAARRALRLLLACSQSSELIIRAYTRQTDQDSPISRS